MDVFEQVVADYSMGYAQTELESFFFELWESIKGDVESHRLPKNLTNRRALEIALWRMRADRVPIALSGRAGSDWRAFEDETKRYYRYAPNLEPKKEELPEYWREPIFPLGHLGDEE